MKAIKVSVLSGSALSLRSLRFELKLLIARIRETLLRYRFWQWESVVGRHTGGRHTPMRYIGRKSQRDLAFAVVGGQPADPATAVARHERSGSILISETPVLGAIRVPAYICAVVPLDRSLEAITGDYDGRLRRLILRQIDDFRVAPVVDPDGIDEIDRTMLRPYALARHGQSSIHLHLDEVRQIVHRGGRLDVLYHGNQPVACHLGYAQIRRGRRYWNACRAGYPESVISDPKRLHEINSINTYFITRGAVERGFDFLDLGLCVGRPEDGTLLWKRRRGGWIDAQVEHGGFFVRLPRGQMAKLLWESPLFALERGGLALHLGIPAGRSDDEVAARYREMGFGGLHRIHLHCAAAPSAALIERIQRLYARYMPAPRIVTTMDPPAANP